MAGGTDIRQVGELWSMAEFTFLKLQVDDASFAANAPFGGSGEEGVEVEEGDKDDDSGSLLPFIIGLVFLVVVAVVVKKFLGESSEPPAVDVDVDEE